MPSGYKENIVNDEYYKLSNRYHVTPLGVILDKQTETILPITLIDGRRYVDTGKSFMMFGSSKGSLTSVADIVGLTFKTPHVPLGDYEHLSCVPIDDDWSNLHPTNLIWMYPGIPIKSKNHEGFYHIPGFSKYVISKTGQVINTVSGRAKSSIKTVLSDSISIRADGADANKMPAVCIYRLMMLTFKPYPKNVRKLTANHIDSDRSNEDLDNFEWVTQSANLKHAVWRHVLGYIPCESLYKTNEKTTTMFKKLNDEKAYFSIQGNMCKVVTKAYKQPSIMVRISPETILPNGKVVTMDSFGSFSNLARNNSLVYTLVNSKGVEIESKVKRSYITEKYGYGKTSIYLALQKKTPIHGTDLTVIRHG